MYKYILLIFLLALSLSTLAQQSFSYTGKSGVTFVVTDNGLSSIKIGTREVAKGGWHFFNVGALCSTVANKVHADTISKKSIATVNPTTVRVRHEQGDIVTLTTYVFDDEDVRIKMRVENNHPSEDMKMVGFTGLQFLFDKSPEGILNSNSYGQLDSLGQWYRGGIINSCHPSYSTPVGGMYCQDGTFGVGGTPLNTGLARTLFHGSPITNENGKFVQTIEFLKPQPVAHEGAVTVELQLRVSMNCDWKHLLQPYKSYFQATHGPKQYTADNRPLVMYVASSSDYNVSRTNPYGYNGANFSTAEGVNAYCDEVIPLMKRANAQGTIIWAFGGYEPRGAMFRTDFDVLPPAVQQNLPLLRKRFEEANLKLGLSTRPGELTVRGDWNVDWTFLINPNDLQHLEAQVWVRFQRMINAGFTCYYLDTFGDTFGDVVIMKYLREKMGPSIQTYVEQDCDVMLIYSGVYDYVQWDNKAQQWHIGSPSALYQWLVPDLCSMIVSTYDENIVKAHGLPFDYTLAHKCSPTASDMSKYADIIRAATEKYLDEDGQWKK